MGIEDSSSCHLIAGAADDASSSPPSSSAVDQILALIQSDDRDSRLQAARDIRRLTKTSRRHRRQFAGAVEALVDMLRCGGDSCANEAALAALLNLAVKDETNKGNIIQAGALNPIIGFLQSENTTLQEHATASLITLSASPLNKPIIASSGAIPHLINILKSGGPQAKLDSVLALYNLSTHPENTALILQSHPIPPLISLLKSCKKSSKTAEKCTALIESLLSFDEGRNVITSEEGGILAVVEVLECGTPQSREHAVGALLTMCLSDRSRYREPILGEGVIPGLLELTVQGTDKSRSKARTLLRLLRESPYPRSEARPETLENIVCGIISRIDGEDHVGKAKEMLSEMVQVSMEQSLRHLQQRASLVCTPAEVKLK